MFELLSTFIKGAKLKAPIVRAAMDASNQTIREANDAITGTRKVLVTLLMRQRNEQRAIDIARTRKAALEDRIREALATGNDERATESAIMVADLENEEDVRVETVARIEDKVRRLRLSIEKATRRVSDLREGALTAFGGVGSFGDEIIGEVDAVLSQKALGDRLTAAGFAPEARVRAEDVLARLKSIPAPVAA
jgi:hypothetical protein